MTTGECDGIHDGHGVMLCEFTEQSVLFQFLFCGSGFCFFLCERL
jgi:hypothetical protein